MSSTNSSTVADKENSPSKKLRMSTSSLVNASETDGGVKTAESKPEIIIENYTPHDVHIYDAEKKNVIKTFPRKPDCPLPRLTETFKDSGQKVDGAVPIFIKSFGAAINLPEYKDHHMYIVSSIIADSPLARDDLCYPDTGPEGVVRDDKGRIIGTTRLCRPPKKFTAEESEGEDQGN